MDKKNNNKNKYIFLGIIIVIILIYLVYIIFNLIKNPTDTFLVQNGQLASEEAIQGYIIRDELVLKGENYKNGMYQIKSEGDKVAKGESIFRYYTSGEEKILKQIEELDIKIQEAWNNESDIFTRDIKQLEQQIENKLNDIYKLNDIQKIKEYKKDLNSYITKKAKIAGEYSPSGSYLKKMIEERSELENKLNQGSEYLNATKAGVISYRVDGLEQVLTPNNLGSLSKKMLEELNLKTGQIVASSEESGKIIDNFYCYIACVLKSENIDKSGAKLGDKIKLRLSNSKETTAEIIYIAQESNDEYLVVFKIDKYIEDLISYRKISLDIIWWNASGLKIPNEAIKYENENLAYVIRKKVGYTDKIYVKILRQSEQYSIIENYTNAELTEEGLSAEEVKNRKVISLYDEIEI